MGGASFVRVEMPQIARYDAASASLCVDDEYCESGPKEWWPSNWQANFQLSVELPHLSLEYGSLEHTPPSFGELHSLRVTYFDVAEQPVKAFSTHVKLHRASTNGFLGSGKNRPCQPIVQYLATAVTETGQWQERLDESLDRSRF